MAATEQRGRTKAERHDRPSRTRGTRLRRVLLWVTVALVAVVVMFPIYWMFATAVRPASELFIREFQLVPGQFRFENFVEAWRLFPFTRWYFNSITIALIAVSLTVSINLICGYALAKFRFIGRKVFFLAVVGTLMLPIQVIMISQFRIVAELGLLNSIWGVIIPVSAEAFGIFLARQFMLSMPDDLLEAARVDGASEFMTFFRIVLPNSKPLIAVLVIFTFGWRWNDFVWPLIVLRTRDSLTVPVGLALLRGQHQTDYTAMMSMTLISVIPVVLVFLVFQRYFVQGIATTGIK